MLEWNEAVQKMIRWVEANLDREPALLEMSRQVGYSPWYCSTLFHRICGDTVKSYAARRRLSLAALDLRDSEDRILDIAVKHGFSSQEALTRAFRGAFGCTPAAYRRNPRPIPLFMGKEVFHPWQYSQLYKGGSGMSVHDLREARVRVEYIPAHKYIGIWEDRAQGYGDFWQYHDCDHVCGIIESMRRESHPVVASHTAGWHYVDGQRRYFYGFGVSQDYSGPVPEGFELRSFPGSYYLVFYHPPFGGGSVRASGNGIAAGRSHAGGTGPADLREAGGPGERAAGPQRHQHGGAGRRALCLERGGVPVLSAPLPRGHRLRGAAPGEIEISGEKEEGPLVRPGVLFWAEDGGYPSPG